MFCAKFKVWASLIPTAIFFFLEVAERMKSGFQGRVGLANAVAQPWPQNALSRLCKSDLVTQQDATSLPKLQDTRVSSGMPPVTPRPQWRPAISSDGCSGALVWPHVQPARIPPSQHRSTNVGPERNGSGHEMQTTGDTGKRKVPSAF